MSTLQRSRTGPLRWLGASVALAAIAVPTQHTHADVVWDMEIPLNATPDATLLNNCLAAFSATHMTERTDRTLANRARFDSGEEGEQWSMGVVSDWDAVEADSCWRVHDFGEDYAEEEGYARVPHRRFVVYEWSDLDGAEKMTEAIECMRDGGDQYQSWQVDGIVRQFVADVPVLIVPATDSASSGGSYFGGPKTVVLYVDMDDGFPPAYCRGANLRIYAHELVHAIDYQLIRNDLSIAGGEEAVWEARYREAVELSRMRHGTAEGCYEGYERTGDWYWQFNRAEFVAEMLARATLPTKTLVPQGRAIQHPETGLLIPAGSYVGYVGLNPVNFPGWGCQRDERYPIIVWLDDFNPVFFAAVRSYMRGTPSIVQNHVRLHLGALERSLAENRSEDAVPMPVRDFFARPFMEVPRSSWEVRGDLPGQVPPN